MIAAYFLALRLLQQPIAIIGNAIGQALLSDKQKNIDLSKQVKTIFLILVNISIVPVIVFLNIQDIIIDFIFGQKWSNLGEVTIALLPWMLTVFCISPLSVCYIKCKQQKLALKIQLFSTFIRITVLILCIILKLDLTFQ